MGSLAVLSRSRGLLAIADQVMLTVTAHGKDTVAAARGRLKDKRRL